MTTNIGTVTIEVALWDEAGADALVEKIRKDARVLSVRRVDQ